VTGDSGASTHPDGEHTVGVYVHVPFCERVCPYCDFAVVAAPRLPAAVETRYVDALLREFEVRRAAFGSLGLATIYLGGGTPSLLSPEQVARLLGAVRAGFEPCEAEELEVTLEVNPSTVERERLPGFREAGVSRLSIGVQSFRDETLRRLGRAHRAPEATETLAAARAAGFENLSLDLIFGAPGQRMAHLEQDLAQTLACAPEHVSAYCLTIEPDTPFALADRRSQLDRAGEEEAAAMMERVIEGLAHAGYEHYEVSSHARPGRRSRHNQRYWAREPVLGLGMGAWSSEPPRPTSPFGARRANEPTLAAWLERIEAGAAPPDDALERLEEATARSEAAFLALRTRDGLDARRFAAEFGGPPRSFWEREIDELCANGLLRERADASLALTARGFLLADAVCERFVAAPMPSGPLPDPGSRVRP
jgi:oxygen-independent coproporphyrinogen-3 oxidase